MRSRHSEYLQTLPPDWYPAPLRSIGEIVSGSTPSRAIPSNWNGDIPWVTPGELTSLRSKYLTDTRDRLTRAGLAACSSGLLPVDTLLVTTRATVGVKALSGMRVATNQGFKSVVFNDEADPHFYYHLFDLLPSELVRLASGTTFLEISGREFSEIVVPCPAKTEQRRIAAILDTLDDAIRRTEQVIAKLLEIKQGLLHDLLTRGVDDHGALRPTPDDAPHLYKDSPLGRIPRKWAVADLASSCEAIVDCPHSTPRFQSEGVLVARTMHIKDGRYDEMQSSRVSETEYRHRIERLEPAPGDVVFTREAPVGEAFVVPEGMRICLGQRVMLLRPSPRWLLGNYLVYQMYFGATKARISVLTSGTTNPHLNVGDVRELELPLPPPDEQQTVVDAVEALDRRVAVERNCLGNLRAVKAGLAEDLLSGRVRTAEGQG